MAEGHDDDEQEPVINRVEDSVVAHSEPVALSPTEWSRRRWTRIVGQKGNGPLDSRLRRTVNRAKFA